MNIAEQLYAHALEEYKKLPHVSDDYGSLDGTLKHLVFRAQHELDLLSEGEVPDDMSFTKAEQLEIRQFIQTYGDQEDIAWLLKHTPSIVKHVKRRKS